LHTGCGLEKPNERDSFLGPNYNHFIFANAIFDITPRLRTGLELTSWKTLYHDTRVGQIPDEELSATAPGKSLTIDWMVSYAF
jgi:hypothetical protein